MEHYIYILQSQVNNSFYKGITSDLPRRYAEHNNKEEKSTHRYAPWDLVWKCKKPTKAEAYKLEKKLKNLTKERLIKFMDKYPLEDDIGGPDVTAYRQSG
jgi:putative endonuclease